VIEYRDLPAVIGFDAATRSGASQLHADIPGNLAFEYETGDSAAVDAAFAGAAHRSRFTLRSQRLVGNPIEPRAFLAAFEQASGVFTVYSPSQGMNGMRGFIAAATGLPRSWRPSSPWDRRGKPPRAATRCRSRRFGPFGGRGCGTASGL